MNRPLKHSIALAIAGITLLLAGCVTPRVVHVYDQKCQVMTRRMELNLQKVQALDACTNHECVVQVLGGAVSLAASTVISGSVALVGNVAFWLEKSANCKPARAADSTTIQGAPVPAARASNL